MLTRIDDNLNMISGNNKEYLHLLLGKYLLSSSGSVFRKIRNLFSNNTLLFWKYRYDTYRLISSKFLMTNTDYDEQILFSMIRTINANQN